ncbi:MAG: response regulator, partial [Actinobacteria bacterium]|nr:response regulator [Actinomycetota bacterium]
MSERILIADDDPDILRFIEVNLSLEGFDLIVASDGETALQSAIDELPDLVLLDVMMPKIDGFEVCRRLRADPRTSNVSVIMLTAKSLSADKVVGLTAGADDYIIKPFDPIELIARVRSTLRRAKDIRDLNPLTGLPGNVVILQELERRINRDEPFALMHVDLDNFKAFNDYYGFMRGDLAIKLTAKVLGQSAMDKGQSRAFVGHIGGDDFAIICSPDMAEVVAKEIIERFDEQISSLYDPEDAERGSITIKDRRDEVQQYPLMTISIGISGNSLRKVESH